MPQSTLAAVWQGLLGFAKALPMSFQAVHFFLFLPLAVSGYFLLPKAFRRPFLLLASYWFYFFTAPKYLVVLVAGTLLSYGLGRLIDAGQNAARTRRLAAAVLIMVLFLCYFKYNSFFAPAFSALFDKLGWAWPQDYFTTAHALGISFYTFTSLAYLVDVARGDTPCQKNLLHYALFLGFFPSVTMGPIARAGQVMPQLLDTSRRFDALAATAALRRMALGLFKKLCVANTLAVFTSQIYASIEQYQGFTLTLAAAAFAVQLYFDFSGYSDIAIATAALFGVKLAENFNHPHFSTNFSAFWSRWHISLSSFLQDYVFTPLVWSRWTEKLPFIGKRVQKPPVLSAIFITFMLSGLWHGDTFPFVIWGFLMAAYRIGEEVLHRRLGKPKKKPPAWQRVGKNAVVLVLWMESLVFFQMGMTKSGTAAKALSALGRQFVPSAPAQWWNDLFDAVQSGFYNDGRIALCFVAFAAACTAVALWADWFETRRLKGGSIGGSIAALPTTRRWAVYLILSTCLLAGFIMQSGGYGGANFLYGGF